MKNLRRTGIIAGLSVLAAAAPALAAGPADVTVRVEGAAKTLVPRTAVTTTTTPVSKDGEHSCSGTSAAGALEIATGGDWNGTWYDGLGYTVESVKGEQHVFPDPDYFSFWLNEKESSAGICGAELQAGDRMLIFVARCEFDGTACANEPVLPLGLSAPRTVTAGAPFTVKVVEYAPDGKPSPVAGATVSGGDAPATTGADGAASVTIGASGEAALRATKENRAPSASEVVCATTGSDGFCGTTRPGETAPPPTAPCVTDGADGRCGTRDRRAPEARITGIAEQQRFRRSRAPRELSGTVSADPSGLHSVKLRLTRRWHGRCWYFSGRRERWVRSRCGRAFRFAIGDRADWTYLLPARLRRGRYVLDAIAIDRAYNRDTLARGRNRVVFHVR